MASIQLSNLQKRYGSVEAIKGISLDIEDGEMVVLVGPSGCGKSTLLRMVAGLESISDGVLRIGENDVSNVEPADRDIAMVFQNYALYPHMSVRDNLAYGLRNRRYAKAEIDTRIAEAARILEIENFLQRRPGQLSGGQRQRVAMGRAIVRNPAAFLFDEPLSNLDAKLRVQMRAEIRKLQKRLRTTSIYVTHDQLEAMTLADKLVVMNGGRIEQIGSPMEVYARPQTLFVASFIGSPPMNLLTVASLRSCVTGLPNLRSGTDVIGVRPDSFTTTAGGQNSVCFNGIVELIEPLGNELHVHVRLDGCTEPLVVSLSNNSEVVDGSKLALFVDPAELHQFNKSTGRRTGPA